MINELERLKNRIYRAEELLEQLQYRIEDLENNINGLANHNAELIIKIKKLEVDQLKAHVFALFQAIDRLQSMIATEQDKDQKIIELTKRISELEDDRADMIARIQES
jgi:uncharacterized protein YoxC